MINRYCEKMKMMGVSKGILTKLFEAGLIESIGDLYRLTPEKIMSLDGFKEKSANNIINSIRKASADVPLSRWMGALPIKDISAKTWQLVIDARYPMYELKASNAYRNAIQNGTPDSFMTECIPNYVYGFSTNTYAAMREGLVLYWDEIQDVIQYINFKCTTNITKPIKGRVTLTGTRDGKLISYLIEKGYDVNDYSSKTIALIIPQKGYVSSKVVKAKKMGIPVYTIEEAYEAL
jgi:DNA ligase (NAD+)